MKAEVATRVFRGKTIADVSGEAMNVVYDWLKTLTLDELRRAVDWAQVKMGDNIPMLNLFEHQIAFTVWKKRTGQW